MKNIIVKYLEGNAGEKEMHKLLHWLDNKENWKEFEEVKTSWKVNLDGDKITNDTLKELDKFKSTMLTESTGRIRKLNQLQNIFRYAAIFFLLVAVGSVFFYFNKDEGKHNLQYNTLFAENGQISKAQLPDGTLVWLNSGSSLKYDNHFGIENRNIELSGQAYFDVTKNKKLPMQVACGEVSVRVLGTQFNAEAYPDDRTINVVLEEGSVELRGTYNETAFAKLSPGEMISYNKESNHFRIEKVKVERFTSWKMGLMNFYNLPLKEAILKLERRYNQKFILDKKLEDYPITMSIQNEPLDTVLGLLNLITQEAEIVQQGEEIIIKYKKEYVR